MNYTPEQARDWCYEVRVKPMPISSAIPIMQSLADQVERLTDENIALRTPKAVARAVVAPPTECKHGIHCRLPYSRAYVCRDCGKVMYDEDAKVDDLS